jgi:hypothetical protein
LEKNHEGKIPIMFRIPEAMEYLYTIAIVYNGAVYQFYRCDLWFESWLPMEALAVNVTDSNKINDVKNIPAMLRVRSSLA